MYDKYDVCIIGSGFAGTYLGLRLIEEGLKTVIVEAGGDVPPHAPAEGRVGLFPHTKSGNNPFPVDFNRTIGVGGTSRKWNGVVARFLPSDFRSKSTFGLFEDWPIAFDEVAAYYDAAELALEMKPGPSLPPSESHEAFIPGAGDQAFVPLNFSVRKNDGEPVRLRDEYIPRFMASGHGTLMSDCPAIRIITDENGAINGVETGQPHGPRRVVRASIYVIAAGVVETVRLLLTSTSPRFSQGIGNAGGLVGRAINAHPRPRFAVPRTPAQASVRGVFRTHSYCDAFRKQGRASVCVDVNFTAQNPFVDLTIETEPHLQNRIQLDARTRDVYGRPSLHIVCEQTGIDQRTRKEADALHRAIVRQWPGPNAALPEEVEKCFHLSGGCCMARQADRGVVNTDGLVFGTPNLYVAGASVFPTSGALNPTLTIVALSLRLGDHLTTILHPHAP